jgi:hypothetical protein
MSSLRALLGVVQHGGHLPACKKQMVGSVEQVPSCDDGFGSNLRSREAEEALGEGWEVFDGFGSGLCGDVLRSPDGL